MSILDRSRRWHQHPEIKAHSPMQIFEVWVEGESKHRDTFVFRADADALAKQIAEDEFEVVEVRPRGERARRMAILCWRSTVTA